MHRHNKGLRVFRRDVHAHYDSADVVIVGNGIAGLTAALEARRLAPEKRIVIITEQSHPTINTPALKQFAIGKLAQEQLLAYPAGTEYSQHIEVVNAQVSAIQAREKYLSLSDGQHFGYGSLLLATGSKPKGLPANTPGRNFDGVLSLHRLSDYLDLRRRLRLREVQTAVVVGGGLHAMETVMGLLHESVNVHWLIRSATFLPSMLDQTASEMVLEYSRRMGVHISTETELAGIVGRIGVVAGVVTNNEQTIPCQLVLICTGTTPVTTLAEHCDVPIKHESGILVDHHLRTNIRDIYAAGDAVALWNPQTGAYQRQAYWHAAVSQGRIAGAAMVGSQEEAASSGVHWHATQLGELSLLTVGSPLHRLMETTLVTDRRKGSYRLLSIRNDRLVGYLSLGKAQPDSLAIKRIIEEGLPVRNIERNLCTGEFDARQYFAQRQTNGAYVAYAAHTTRKMEVTGKLAVPDTPLPRFQTPRTSPERETSHDTEPLSLTSLFDGLNEMSYDEEPAQKRIEGPTPSISSITSLMSKQMETGQWVVPAILPEGLVILAGKQKIGKSLLGLTIGLGVASGETVLGDIDVEQGHVLYLSLEEDERRLQERLSQLLVLGASLHHDFEYATSWPHLAGDGLADIESWLVSHPQARLVIIDSWASVSPEGEQQGNGIARDARYELFEPLRELAHAYHVSILVHFHTEKAPTDPFFGKLTARSSTYPWADGILHLKQSRGNRNATLTSLGQAYAPGLNLALSFNGGYWKMVEQGLPELKGQREPQRQQGRKGREEQATVPTRETLSQARRAIIEILHERDRPMKSGEIALALGKRDQTVRKMLSSMKASSLIEATDEGYVALVPQ